MTQVVAHVRFVDTMPWYGRVLAFLAWRVQRHIYFAVALVLTMLPFTAVLPIALAVVLAVMAWMWFLFVDYAQRKQINPWTTVTKVTIVAPRA